MDMNSTEMLAAADRIRSSRHPAAAEIADLLTDTAAELRHREQNWNTQEWPATVQTDLTHWLYKRHIALAHALTTKEVA